MLFGKPDAFLGRKVWITLALGICKIFKKHPRDKLINQRSSSDHPWQLLAYGERLVLWEDPVRVSEIEMQPF